MDESAAESRGEAGGSQCFLSFDSARRMSSSEPIALTHERLRISDGDGNCHRRSAPWTAQDDIEDIVSALEAADSASPASGTSRRILRRGRPRAGTQLVRWCVG